jgi:hypothetical protein
MVKLMNILHTLVDFVWNVMSWPDPLRPVDSFVPQVTAKKVYIPDPTDLKYPDDVDITAPQVCPMNEGDQLCIHRSHDAASILDHINKLGYHVTAGDVERCHYQADYDHYPVTKD